MESLGKIFGSNNRVKIMRLFLFNETEAFDIDDVMRRSLLKKVDARKEINMLAKIGFLKQKSFSKKAIKTTGKNKKINSKRKQVKGWILNNKFDLTNPLRTLLVDSELVREKDLITRIKKAGGKITFLVLSGLFTRDRNRKLDILIVGNKLKRLPLEKEIFKLESEIGRELTYAIFDAEEFNYRLRMSDKLIRDVIENDHRMLVNKIIF